MTDLVERLKAHDLKTWPGPFAAVRAGLKPWELRKNDRDFRVGDLLRLREWSPVLANYSGEIEERKVTWMLEGPAFGLPEGYVIMSLQPSPAPVGEWREAVARIIDPEAFRLVNALNPEARADKYAALAKADQISALGREGEQGTSHSQQGAPEASTPHEEKDS